MWSAGPSVKVARSEGRQKSGVTEPSPHTHGVRRHFRQMCERQFAAFLSWMSFSVNP